MSDWLRPDNIHEWLAATATAMTVLGGGVAAWVKYVRPSWKRAKWERQAKNDVLIGRPPVMDSITGKELAPALPGVGTRMDMLTEAVAKLADTHTRLDDHEDRIKALEAAGFERAVTRAESAQAWRAIEAVAKGQPNPAPDEFED